MLGHYNELVLTTAHDGASASIGIGTTQDSHQIDDLMDAWFRERQECIEMGLFLEEARHLLKRILTDDELTSSCRRQAVRLLLAIKASKQSHRQRND